MLPTFPKIIARRDQLNADAIRRLVKAKAPMLADISGHIIHEGKSTAIARPSGEIDPTKMVSVSAEFTIAREEVGEFVSNHEKLLDRVAEQFADSQSKHVIEVITEATDKTGNVVDGQGQPFSDELLYQALEKMWHSFTPQGAWQPPTLVVHPDLYKKIQEYDENRTPAEKAAFDKKLRKLIETKRAEYVAEQAGRILAG